ncbi:DUF596 domain-containing protein [Cupriavidus basilensis]|uniref:DUF596 domain-containing protein n=1 Tax=Cupriavidus basilensis TaxID=68895 RepID=UPI0039F6AC47
MFSKERAEEIAYLTEGMALDAVWMYVRQDYGKFEDSKNAFFWLLGRFLDSGVIKIGKRGNIIKGDSSDIVELFRRSFPLSEEELEEGTGLAIWFFSDSCPGGAVWIGENGEEEWT